MYTAPVASINATFPYTPALESENPSNVASRVADAFTAEIENHHIHTLLQLW